MVRDTTGCHDLACANNRDSANNLSIDFRDCAFAARNAHGRLFHSLIYARVIEAQRGQRRIGTVKQIGETHQ
jgi:hypothetical protein